MVEEKIGNDNKGPDMKIWNKNSQLSGIDFSNSDWIYTPIIQSGGKYDLKISAESNSDNLKSGVVLASMGIKYKEYCANIARTFLIGPDNVRAPPRVRVGSRMLMVPSADFSPRKPTTSSSWNCSNTYSRS